MNYKDLLAQNAQKFGDKLALIYGDRGFSFQELESQTNQAAHVLLSLGMGRGSRVALLLPPGADAVTAFFGVNKIAAIAVTLDPRASGPDLDYLLRDCQAQALVTNRGALEPLLPRLDSFESIKHVIVMGKADPGPYHRYENIALSCPNSPPEIKVKDDDVDMIQYTSGTTGLPKGVMTTHGGHLAALTITAQTYGQNERDVFLIPEMPPAWMLAQLVGSWACGSPVAVVTQPGHLPFLESVAQLKASLVFAPMPIVFQMARMPEAEAKRFKLASLRLLLTGGLVPPQEIFTAIRHKFGVHLILGYACNEAGGWIALQPLDGKGKPGSAGRAMPGTQIRILDESGRELAPHQVGEIVAHGPGVMKGYYNRPLASAEALRDGWLFTGDLGKLDEAGELFVVGRKKELIKIGNREILPADIEEVLCTHPAVAEVAVAAIASGLKAVVVLKPGAIATAQDIIHYSIERLAPDELPRIVEFAASLPRTLTGKVRRWALTQ